MDQKANYLSLILLDALEDENESDINYILERHAKAIDPGYVPQDRGIAPLHYACGMENDRLSLEVTKRFLEMGANPNCKTEDDMTPLHVAAIYGKVEIVRLLLRHGADLEVYDNERKSPILYAFENCYFDVVQLMRDHIFLKKYEKRKKLHSTLFTESKFENSLNHKCTDKQSTPKRLTNENGASPQCINKTLLKITNVNDSLNKSTDVPQGDKTTPGRVYYNYDVTSPYYINITHRRHKPQPIFPGTPTGAPPAVQAITAEEETTQSDKSDKDVLSVSMQRLNLSSPEPDDYEEAVNIFSLTRENLKELTQRTGQSAKTRTSLIESWREKVQRARPSVSELRQYDDVNKLIEDVMKNDHLNFSNTKLIAKPVEDEQKDNEIDSGAGDSSSPSVYDDTEYLNLPQQPEAETPHTPNLQVDKELPISELQRDNSKEQAEMECLETPMTPFKEATSALGANYIIDVDSSYQTVPEIQIQSPAADIKEELNGSTNFIKSPKNTDFFLQMTEAYLHTDDENGVVFFETKLPANVGNKMAQQRLNFNGSPESQKMNSSVTTQSTNITIPLDYETDTLRAELTVFGEPPGPITTTTKRLYVKKLMKYKRKTDVMQALNAERKEKERKFSVELQRTLKSEEDFLRIQDYLKYDTQSAEFFVNHQDKKKMREGHLKQSFIYMLIDPRISCNLPGESVFLDKFESWQRFLHSIFYVGKGKTSRPYSHLYDAMRVHSRMHNQELHEKMHKGGKKISIKKQPLNLEAFKSPPQKSSNSKKLDRIMDIWGHGYGVVCLHVFHNIVPTDAYTREAAIIDALGLRQLTNCKRGDYYGPAQNWTMKEKKYLGIALLCKAMHIYLAEGESQLSPGDLV